MAKTRIIGHRGAAGLALENTMASFQKAVEAGATVIEFDVRTTSDNVFVVCHDESLKRVSDTPLVIADTSFRQLRTATLHNGESLPLLTDVLDFAREHSLAVIVEVKTSVGISELCQLLDNYTDLDMRIASFLHEAIKDIRQLRPSFKCYLAEKRHPLRAVFRAKAMGAVGLDLNYKLLNPITYWLAKRYQLEIMVYTVNSRFVGILVRLLYPGVDICSNYPNRFIKKRAIT